MPSNKPVNHYKVRRATEIMDKKDAHSCGRCGQIFPKEEVKLLWEHRSKCTAPIKRSRSRITRSHTVSSRRMSASDNLLACKKCGQTFLWEQIQLYWKHSCKPSDETCLPDHPQQPIQPNVANSGQPVFTADGEGEDTITTIHVRVKNDASDAPYVCKCGKTFTSNERRQYKMHTWKCPKGVRTGKSQTVKEVV